MQQSVETLQSQNSVKFSYEGSTVNVFKFNEKTSSDMLIPQIYSLGKSMFGYFLTIKANRFENKTKTYGLVHNRVKKVLNTAHTRNKENKSTGILFTGHKGSGKTMTTNMICNAAIDELNLPVILVEFAASGPGFVDFIESLGECVLLFDEFGKTYNNSENNQDDLLSLLDGTGMSKRLVLMTENNEKDISSFLLGRPGRIFYHFKYGKLEPEIIKEVCQEQNISEAATKEILDVSRTAKIFSFDILNAIIEEHQRYGESIMDLIKDLNLGIEEDIEVRMETVKAVIIETGEELNIPIAYRFFTKPQEYDSSRIRLSLPIEQIKTNQLNLKENYLDHSHGQSEYRITFEDLKAEEKDTCIYIIDNGKIAVTAKYAPIDNFSFNKYL